MNYGYDYTQRFYNGSPYKGRFHHGEVYVNHNFSSNVELLDRSELPGV